LEDGVGTGVAGPETPPALQLDRGISIFVLNSLEAERAWPELSVAIKEAFAGVEFCDGFGPESPVEHSQAGIVGPERDVYRHVVARIRSEVVGATFRVPVVLPEGGGLDADPGWYFTARTLGPRAQTLVAAALIEQSHRLMKEAGFARVVTNMGTPAGANYLKRRWAYAQASAEGVTNRWIRLL
jgi:hypothetical protein